jgi:hypothetical protein
MRKDFAYGLLFCVRTFYLPSNKQPRQQKHSLVFIVVVIQNVRSCARSFQCHPSFANASTRTSDSVTCHRVPFWRGPANT